jgi:hypothetical protein
MERHAACSRVCSVTNEGLIEKRTVSGDPLPPASPDENQAQIRYTEGGRFVAPRQTHEQRSPHERHTHR